MVIQKKKVYLWIDPNWWWWWWWWWEEEEEEELEVGGEGEKKGKEEGEGEEEGEVSVRAIRAIWRSRTACKSLTLLLASMNKVDIDSNSSPFPMLLWR